MSTKITLSGSKKAKATARAVERGCKGLSDYVGRLIDEDSASSISPEIEATILKRLDGRSRELTHADWEAKRNRIRQSARRKKAG